MVLPCAKLRDDHRHARVHAHVAHRRARCRSHEHGHDLRVQPRVEDVLRGRSAVSTGPRGVGARALGSRASRGVPLLASAPVRPGPRRSRDAPWRSCARRWAAGISTRAPFTQRSLRASRSARVEPPRRLAQARGRLASSRVASRVLEDGSALRRRRAERPSGRPRPWPAPSPHPTVRRAGRVDLPRRDLAGMSGDGLAAGWSSARRGEPRRSRADGERPVLHSARRRGEPLSQEAPRAFESEGATATAEVLSIEATRVVVH